MRQIRLHRHSGVRQAIPALLAFALALAGCAGGEDAGADAHDVVFNLQNTGRQPISCRLIYGHWVERDYGDLAPGAFHADRFRQQASDGAFFTMRPDGRKRMMIETVQCASYPNWKETVGQVDFAPARGQKVDILEARCALPEGGGRIVCEPLKAKAAD
ncbi:hypothetical protein [Dongia sp.]|uniref:hypothetical protein n=1 Tax=Dongia sp. TaxID=1977262 RepID=UPI0035B24AF9